MIDTITIFCDGRVGEHADQRWTAMVLQRTAHGTWVPGEKIDDRNSYQALRGEEKIEPGGDLQSPGLRGRYVFTCPVCGTACAVQAGKFRPMLDVLSTASVAEMSIIGIATRLRREAEENLPTRTK